MHLLHLVEPWNQTRAEPLERIAGTDAAAEGAAACLATTSYHTHAALIVGPRSAEIRARALGVRTFDTVCPIHDSRRHGVALLRRLLAHRTSPDRIVVWSSHLDSWARQFDVQIVRPWESELKDVAARIPGVRAQTHLRSAMRTNLGIEDDAVVIALADDPPMEADLWTFAAILSMLETAGAPVIGVAPIAAHQRGRGRRFLRTHGLSQNLVLIDEPIWAFSPAIDLAVVTTGVSSRAREFGELPASSAREFSWSRVMAAERMQFRGVPTMTVDAIAIPAGLHSQAVAFDGRASSLAGKLLPLAESALARRDFEGALTNGVPAHAKALASHLLWQLTAMPGEAAPSDALQEAIEQ